MNSSDKLWPGQRVWVHDSATGEKAGGIISRAWIGGALFRGVGSFLVVELDGGNVVLNCDVDRRGERWDLLPEEVPMLANVEAYSDSDPSYAARFPALIASCSSSTSDSRTSVASLSAWAAAFRRRPGRRSDEPPSIPTPRWVTAGRRPGLALPPPVAGRRILDT